MKKLDSLKIGAIRFKVVYVPDLHAKDEKADGYIQHHNTRISLEASMNHQATTQTLLHEAVHAIAAQIGKQNMNENTVDALAYGVYQLMRDNPELVRMIKRG